MDRRSAAVALSVVAGAVLFARPLGPGPLRLELGAFEGGFTGGAWQRSERADLDVPAAADGLTSFYYRAAPERAALRLPAIARGDARLTLRATAVVRSGVGVFLDGARLGEVLVSPGPWSRYRLELPASALRGRPLELGLALRPLPLVPGEHAADPRILVDFVEVESPAGLVLSWRACALVALAPLAAFAFLLGVGAAGRTAAAAAAAAAGLALLLLRLAPLPTLAALPRLLPAALAAGWVAFHAVRRLGGPARGLAALVAAGTLGHGSLAFFPNHAPPDIDIHVRRTLDLADVPLQYQALLRYGSQLPTASQDRGAATAALGERTLIPYSPLPYLLYYAVHRLGADLTWALTVLNAAIAMLVAPVVFLAARRLWGERAAWPAALLYTLDLAVWHHLGRSHGPAVLGGALGTAALLGVSAWADRLDGARRAALAGLGLGLAALGYSSLVVLFGLFGVLLLALLALDARGLAGEARRGVAAALVLGGLVAGLLFYFHYVPGLLRGAAGVEAEPDLFPGRSFLVFRNESRQSLRLWTLGLWIPLLAGLLAAPAALARARPASRPLLFAWLGAWASIMVLKDPLLFPKLLRWAKEDQFLSPLLCLLVAAACSAPERPWLRRGLLAAALLGALWLQARDFGHHANSLLL